MRAARWQGTSRAAELRPPRPALPCTPLPPGGQAAVDAALKAALEQAAAGGAAGQGSAAAAAAAAEEDTDAYSDEL